MFRSVGRIGEAHTSAGDELAPGSWSRYHRYLHQRIQPFLRGRICELGSGTGQLTQYLTSYDHVAAIEEDACAHLIALQDFAYQLNIQCLRYRLEDCPNPDVPAASFDTVLCVNLLEHLDYDITALETMAELLGDRGHLVVVVPACPGAFGELDRKRGHFRRYHHSTLEDAFNAAGLTVTRRSYFNAGGLLAWWWLSRILGRERLTAGAARFLDRLVPFARFLDSLLELPFGQSLLMIGRRKRCCDPALEAPRDVHFDQQDVA